MIRMNVKAFNDLQGDISDAAFARKLGVSRTQLWRIRMEKSAVGGDFIEKFMICFPDKLVNDYFFAVSAPLAEQKREEGARRGNFFASPAPSREQKRSGGSSRKRGDAP